MAIETESIELFDFNQLTWKSYRTSVLRPNTVNALSRIVSTSASSRTPLRTRGGGHALNGSSTPAQGETLLSTDCLRAMYIEGPESIVVGAGLDLYTIQNLLRTRGLELPVINDGFPGPTVGGFISAGGFGVGSSEAGGFWETVASVTIVDGRGSIIEVTRQDQEFKWLFGAMGQLGIIAQARLLLKPTARTVGSIRLTTEEILLSELEVETNLKIIASGNPQIARDLESMRFLRPRTSVRTDGMPQYWFSFLVSPIQSKFAIEQLKILQERFARWFDFEEIFNYRIDFRSFNPPLIYPLPETFHAIGSWWTPRSLSDTVRQKLVEYEFDVMRIMKLSDYRRYIQSEAPRGPAIYAECFGKPTYDAFRELKIRLDPQQIFNRGSVF